MICRIILHILYALRTYANLYSQDNLDTINNLFILLLKMKSFGRIHVIISDSKI